MHILMNSGISSKSKLKTETSLSRYNIIIPLQKQYHESRKHNKQ